MYNIMIRLIVYCRPHCKLWFDVKLLSTNVLHIYTLLLYNVYFVYCYLHLIVFMHIIIIHLTACYTPHCRFIVH